MCVWLYSKLIIVIFSAPFVRSSHRNPFCVLKVDNEIVARLVRKLVSCPVAQLLPRFAISRTHLMMYRTATVYRTLEPFWGEDYTLHVPNEFQAVSIHVFDYDLMG